MKLNQLQITNFRNLKTVTISPSSDLNLIYGANGSGKSSLLEALHFIGFGRSFRTNKPNNAIAHQETSFTIFAQCNQESESPLSVGLQRSADDQFVCSINGERSNRVSDMASLVPVQIFTPQSIELLIGSPGARRRFIDWGLFHVEHSFSDMFRNYQRVLRQRNALLKSMQISKASVSSEILAQLDYWTNQLSILGTTIDENRKSYWESFEPLFKAISSQFLPEFSFELSYHSGWDSNVPLADFLRQRFDSERRYGYTSYGPHKADFKIKVDGTLAVEVLSRGQLRMLVAALQLAQTKHLFNQKNQSGLFLLDDIGAELDEEKRRLFINELIKTTSQVFVTAIEKQQLFEPTNITNIKVFHVEHGRVTEEQ
ncbi:DNA replication/repair protein RecF [Alteromonas sp. ASW11-36]|uniref:DNA replication and repair protein RecF n=1 Tax=Alteromonas arenosi TaxID=3055817 RepID=A0ABT7ST25_9ALTE|nr:DNA replication/repair protein RecF [Alteromonas sp. ASW11-36]MDM7859347.1 DNA replication/repair protein RecF [Alteromonas sp. ASW11-36]